jgi:hypothetical protein
VKRPAGDDTRRSGLGLLLIAAGQRRGFDYFGKTNDAYLASLAPLVALVLVSTGLMAVQGQVRTAASIGLLSICNLLAPAVIADPLCRRWGCADRWPHYANILNWVQFLFLIVGSLLLALARGAVGAGLLVIYVLWVQWFIARGALGLSRARTTWLLAAILCCSYILITILTLFGSGTSQLQIGAT